MGDIGTHAENLAEYITGLPIDELLAELNTFVRGRKLDDEAVVESSRKEKWIAVKGKRNTQWISRCA